MKQRGRAFQAIAALLFSGLVASSGVAQQKNGPGAPAPLKPAIRSHISVYDLNDRSVHVLYTADRLFESVNWSPDGKYLLANSGGRIYRLELDGKNPVTPEPIQLDASYNCNNDHGISPGGRLLAFSASSPLSSASQVFVANVDGTGPRLLTPKAPSYWHAWSPDGHWLSFVAQRTGHFNIYRVPVTGGEEQQLTSFPSYDDGPDYSPDGKWIYINSDRSGGWDIWRFPADGAGVKDAKAERVTSDDLEDWFPHPSPDGKWMVFLSFPHGTKGHDGRMNIQLRMMPLPGDKTETVKPAVLANIFGGQGTINVNSWSPDSKEFAFVSYELSEQPAK
jgi:TolB protein